MKKIMLIIFLASLPVQSMGWLLCTPNNVEHNNEARRLIRKSIEFQVQRLKKDATIPGNEATLLLALLHYICKTGKCIKIAISQEMLKKYGLLTSKGKLIDPYVCELLAQ